MIFRNVGYEKLNQTRFSFKYATNMPQNAEMVFRIRKCTGGVKAFTET